MILLLIVAGLAAWWGWRKGYLRTPEPGDIAAIAGAIVALRLLSTGRVIPAAIAGAGVALWIYRKRRAQRPTTAAIADARALLEVSPDADAEAIRAAHRRLIAQVHPDAGGSAELARQVNAARDILLSELNRKPPRAS
jgi:ABC-type molybdate transport system substrate-binding protein